MARYRKNPIFCPRCSSLIKIGKRGLISKHMDVNKRPRMNSDLSLYPICEMAGKPYAEKRTEAVAGAER